MLVTALKKDRKEVKFGKNENPFDESINQTSNGLLDESTNEIYIDKLNQLDLSQNMESLRLT